MTSPLCSYCSDEDAPNFTDPQDRPMGDRCFALEYPKEYAEWLADKQSVAVGGRPLKLARPETPEEKQLLDSLGVADLPAQLSGALRALKVAFPNKVIGLFICEPNAGGSVGYVSNVNPTELHSRLTDWLARSQLSAERGSDASKN